MGWHKTRAHDGKPLYGFHALLTDITLDHAQRISIDPGEAVAWGSRTKFIYDNRFQTPELSLGRWW